MSVTKPMQIKESNCIIMLRGDGSRLGQSISEI